MAFKSTVTGQSSSYSPASAIDLTTMPLPTDMFDKIGSVAASPQGEASKPQLDADSSSPSQEAIESDAPSEEASGEAPAEDAKPAAPSVNEIEIKADGKLVKYKLDKDDKELQKTLSYGAVAPRLAKKNKELTKQLTEVQQRLPSLEANAARFEEASDLIAQGYYEDAMKAAFGEENYKKLYNELVIGRIDYDMATPEEKLAMDRKRMEREFAAREYKHNRASKPKAPADDKAKAEAEREALTSMGQAVAAKFSFDGVDGPAKEALSNKLWTLAWNDVEEWMEANASAGTPVKPNKAVLEKAFAHNHRLLTGARGRATPTDVAASAASKDKAKQEASKNYKQEASSGNDDSLSPLERFMRLRG